MVFECYSLKFLKCCMVCRYVAFLKNWFKSCLKANKNNHDTKKREILEKGRTGSFLRILYMEEKGVTK